MKTLKKAGLILLDIIEVWIPTACIAVIFVSFIVNVVSRYIFNKPVNACYELCLAGLLWALLLSALYAIRNHKNVAFTLIYDQFGAWGQLILRLIGTAFLLFCLIKMLYPCFDWVLFMKRKRTAVLKIRYDILYFPFVVFNVFSIGHLMVDFVRDIIMGVNAITGKRPLVAERHTPLSDGDAAEDEVNAEQLENVETAKLPGSNPLLLETTETAAAAEVAAATETTETTETPMLLQGDPDPSDSPERQDTEGGNT